MINIESYYKGFMDGVECKEGHKLHLLGYEFEELLEIINAYLTGKFKMPTKAKMTRAEAIACLDKHNPHNYNTSHMIDFYIEAGMLEIVEETSLTLPQRIAAKLKLPSQIVADVINELDKEGRFILK